MSTMSIEQIHIGKYKEEKDWNTFYPELSVIKDLESKAKQIITCVNATLSQERPHITLTQKKVSSIFYKLAREGTLESKRIIECISRYIIARTPIELVFDSESVFFPPRVKLSFSEKDLKMKN